MHTLIIQKTAPGQAFSRITVSPHLTRVAGTAFQSITVCNVSRYYIFSVLLTMALQSPFQSSSEEEYALSYLGNFCPGGDEAPLDIEIEELEIRPVT